MQTGTVQHPRVGERELESLPELVLALGQRGEPLIARLDVTGREVDEGLSQTGDDAERLGELLGRVRVGVPVFHRLEARFAR